MEKTFLQIPDAMLAYATAYGAVKDPQSNRWYVSGEVPMELLSFVPKLARGPVPESFPSCPKCGSMMVKRYRRTDGGAFWGCSQYPRCPGIVDWTYNNVALAQDALKPILDVPDNDSPRELKPSNVVEVSSLKPYLERIVSMATEKLGGVKAARRWLETSKVAFLGKKPLEVMRSVEGCQRVEQLLARLFD